MTGSTWTNRPHHHFEKAHEVCVVAAVRRGSPLFVPRLFGGDLPHDTVVAIACEDEATGAAMVAELEAISGSSNAPALPALLCLTRNSGPDLVSSLGWVIDQVPANSYLFTTEAVQLDALALGRSARYRHELGHHLLQVDLARAGRAGFRFDFGDYLRYRTYMMDRPNDVVTPPPTLSHLLMGPAAAHFCAERLAGSVPVSAAEQLLLVQLLAEYGVPTALPLVVGYHDRRSIWCGRAGETRVRAVDRSVGDVPALGAILEHCGRRFPAQPPETRLLLGSLLRLHMADYCAAPADADDVRGAMTAMSEQALAQSVGLLSSAVDASVGEQYAVFGLACVLADQLRLPGLDSLELEFGAVVQRLARVLLDAYAAGRFGVTAKEVEPLLNALAEIANATSWSVADDLAWSLFDAARGAEYREVGDKLNVTLSAEKFACLERAMRAHFARGAHAMQRVEELEGQLGQAEAALADVYPGRLATLVTEAFRGSSRDRFALPFRLARLLWKVFVTERLARARISRARHNTKQAT